MRKWTVILAAVLMAASCTTKVRLEDARDHFARFTCTLDNSAVTMADTELMPKWFTMACTRIMKEEHYFWEDVYYTAPKDTIVLEPGEYESLMFVSETPNAYYVENLSPFLEDNATSLRSLNARLARMTDAQLNKNYKGYTPLLASYLETVPPAPAIYRARQRYKLQEGAVESVTFQSQQLVQEVTFRVTIQTTPDLTPNRVVGCVTGVPFRVELLSGWLDVQQTGQTLFDFRHVSGDVWEGKLTVLGIRQSDDATLSVGNGLLLVCVDAGIKHRKVIRVCNLYKYLEETPLLKYSDQEGFFIGGEKSASYTLEDPLILSTNESEHQGDEPISEWIIPTDGNTVPLVDGDDAEEEED